MIYRRNLFKGKKILMMYCVGRTNASITKPDLLLLFNNLFHENKAILHLLYFETYWEADNLILKYDR